MSEQPYPIFDEPIEFRDKIDRERTKLEAERYFVWFTTHYLERVRVLSAYMDYTFTENQLADLHHIGEQATDCLKYEWCCSREPVEVELAVIGFERFVDTKRVLSPLGSSLAIDLGVVLAHMFIQHPGIRHRWELVRRPFKDINFHSPVLCIGKGDKFVPGVNYRFEPKRVGIGLLSAIANGTKNSAEWARFYQEIIDQYALKSLVDD